MPHTNRNHVALSTSLPGGSAPPTEFLIWAFGRVETTKGNFLFDDEGAQSVMASYRTYGNRLIIDYEHKAVDPNRRAGDGKAAGSFQIELRGDGLYAIDVRWTPPAAEALTNKEWLYFSPYFSAEEDSGRIVELINLALTNIPATTHMRPLVAAQRSPFQMADDLNPTTNTTLADEDDDTDADESAKASAKKSARDRLAKARAELEAATAECSAFGEDDEDDDADSEDDEKKSRAAAASAPASTPAAAVAASRREKGSASRIGAVARSLTGKDDEGEVIGALTALSDATRTNVQLSRRVTDLERKLRKSEVESMVTRAVKAGKLTPAEREWALSYGMESPAKLRGYLDVTPPRANIAGVEHREPPLRPGDGRAPTLAVALSDEERRICANTGIDPEKFAAVRHRPVRVG